MEVSLDRLTDLMVGEPESADDAVDQTATAEEDEGAFDPLAVLDELDTPEDDADEGVYASDSETEDETAEEPIDYKARWEADQAKITERENAVATKESEAERTEQLRLMRQADEAWKAEEAQAVNWAEQHPNHKEAIAGLRNYYTTKLQQVLKASEKLIQDAYSGQFVDQVASQAGLTAEDKALLAAIDPKHIPAVAQALAAKNKTIDARLSKIEDKTNNLARGRQAQRRQLTGQDRPAASRGTGSPAQRIQYGSVENVGFLLDATRALKAGRSS